MRSGRHRRMRGGRDWRRYYRCLMVSALIFAGVGYTTLGTRRMERAYCNNAALYYPECLG